MDFVFVWKEDGGIDVIFLLQGDGEMDVILF